MKKMFNGCNSVPMASYASQHSQSFSSDPYAAASYSGNDYTAYGYQAGTAAYCQVNSMNTYPTPYGFAVIQEQTHMTQSVEMPSVSYCSDGMYAYGFDNTCVDYFSSYPADYDPYYQSYYTQCDQPASGYAQQYDAVYQQQSANDYAQLYPSTEVYQESSLGSVGHQTSYHSGVYEGVAQNGVSSYYEEQHQYTQTQQYDVEFIRGVHSLSELEAEAQADVSVSTDWRNDEPACLDRPILLAIEWPYEDEKANEQVASFEKEEQRNEPSCRVQIEEILSPVSTIECSSTEENAPDFEYIEDKLEFEEWDLSLNMPGQESILSEDNMEVLKNKLNYWLSARESSVRQDTSITACVSDSESVSPIADVECLVRMPSDKVPEGASSVIKPSFNIKEERDNLAYQVTDDSTSASASTNAEKTPTGELDSLTSNAIVLGLSSIKDNDVKVLQSDSKPDTSSSQDTTSGSSGWRGCWMKLGVFAGRVCEEIAKCYIKGLLI